MVNGLSHLYQAANVMHNKMTDISITANNLANINTVGFKRELPFAEVISRLTNSPVKQLTDFSEGVFSQTGNPLDLAISKNGFFMIKTDKGVQLTKNGHFKLTEDGGIVDSKGNPVMTQGGDLNLLEYTLNKDNEIKISKDGEITVGKEVVDQLKIAKIDDPTGMVRESGQNFSFPNGGYSEASEDDYEIEQGYLEGSNTNAILEMEQMISMNKEYETAQKIIKAIDQQMGMAKEIGKI